MKIIKTMIYSKVPNGILQDYHNGLKELHDRLNHNPIDVFSSELTKEELHSAINKGDIASFKYYCKNNDLKNARLIYSRGFVDDDNVIDVYYSMLIPYLRGLVNPKLVKCKYDIIKWLGSIIDK